MKQSAIQKAAAATTARPDREGKRMLAGYFDPETCRAIKVLAAEQDKTSNLLLAEALRLVLERHAKPVPPALKRQLGEVSRPRRS